MKLISLVCNHCGGTLEIPEETRYLTCQFCKTNLMVESSGNAFFTSELEELDRKTDQIADEVESLKRENNINRLDRNWESQKEKFMVTDKDGHKRLPTKTTSIVGGVFVVVVGIAWLIFTASNMSDMPGAFGTLFPLFGLLFIVVGLVQVVIAYNKAGQYERAYRKYQRQRRKVNSKSDNVSDNEPDNREYPYD